MNYESFTYLRGRTIPSFESHEDDDPKAMIFVVNDNKEIELSDTDVIESVIASMVALLATVDARPQIDAWLDGRIRKLVKRGRNKQWADLNSVDNVFTEATVNTATVKAYAPVAASQVAPEIRKLQLTGLKTVPASHRAENTPSLHVTISSGLSMSVSKSAAQAAHAVQLFIMQADEELVKKWVEAGCPVTVDFGEVYDSGEADRIHVYDAGLTEIPAGSLTATATYVS